MLKKHILKIMVFITNIAVAALGTCFIKSEADKKSDPDAGNKTAIVPIAEDVAAAQEKIALDREQKLRDQNTDPKEIKKNNTITTTTTTTKTKAPAAASKSTTKTKTS